MKTMIPLLVALPLLALHAGDPALARTSEPVAVPTAQPAMPVHRPVREDEQGCCKGTGGPIEEGPAVVVEHVADPAGEWRRWVAPTDPDLERRYARRPTPSLNPITLRF